MLPSLNLKAELTDKLQARFAFCTNGRRIYRIDMETGKEGYVERYPTPDELWAEVFKTPNEWRDRFAAVSRSESAPHIHVSAICEKSRGTIRQ